MKQEISAGGVIIRKKVEIFEYLLLLDAQHQWTFPKGIIETEESEITAARREIMEETGLINLQLLTKLSSISYQFKRDTQIDKTVHYFLFFDPNNQGVKLQYEEGLHDYRWLTFVDALRIIGYKQTNVRLLQEADQYVKEHAL